MIPEFKSFFRYQDLTDCKEDIKMKIDMHSILYLVRKKCFPKTHEIEKQPEFVTDNWDEERKVVDRYEKFDKRIIDFYKNPLEECAK